MAKRWRQALYEIRCSGITLLFWKSSRGLRQYTEIVAQRVGFLDTPPADAKAALAVEEPVPQAEVCVPAVPASGNAFEGCAGQGRDLREGASVHGDRFNGAGAGSDRRAFFRTTEQDRPFPRPLFSCSTDIPGMEPLRRGPLWGNRGESCSDDCALEAADCLPVRPGQFGSRDGHARDLFPLDLPGQPGDSQLDFYPGELAAASHAVGIFTRAECVTDVWCAVLGNCRRIEELKPFLVLVRSNRDTVAGVLN